MATTTATINITSDIGPGISISKTMEMHKLQSPVGLEETSGLRAKKFTGTAAVTIIEEDEFTDTKASKVYIRNTGSSREDFFYVAKHATAAASDTTETIGKLYGGDFMLMPYDGATNITVAPSVATTMNLEYIVFVE
mgnify:FL=1|tara:strand:+ start:136 stop:546 length:411 start_codon:yes stop_codon:yes gene_type:complete